MKDSGVKWIGEIPEDWKVEKAKLIFEQRNTKGNENAVLLSATQANGMYPQSLLEGVVQVKVDTDLNTFKTVHKNDFVISLRSFQGGFEMSDYEGVCSPAYQVFYNKVPICHKYYKLLFKSQGFISYINSLVVGIREGKNIQYSSFSYSEVPVPPLAEQTRISNYLDSKCTEIDELVKLEERMITELQKYKQSVITETVTRGLNKTAKLKDSGVEWIGMIPEEWGVGKVSYFYEITLGKMLQPNKKENDDALYPYICAVNLGNNKLKMNNLREMWFSKEEIANYQIKNGDLLVVEGGDVASSDIVSKLTDEIIGIQNAVHLVRSNRNYSLRYLRYYLIFIKSIGYIDLICNRATISHFTKEKFSNLPILVVSIDEQERISSYLDKKTEEIDGLIKLKESKIQGLKDYKKSLIYEYVTGKKKV